jgi:hypothetical protein
LVLAVLLAGCGQVSRDAQSPSPNCYERFGSKDLELMVDKLVMREKPDQMVGVLVSFDVKASDRPVKELENLLARLGSGRDMALERVNGRWLIHVERSSMLIRNGSTLTSELRKACAVARNNNAEIVAWRVRLPDIELDDGLMHLPTVP